jgi:PAS domain S-box-containing protein
MSWVTIIWSMVASACLTLAAVYLLVWCKKRTEWANLLFSLTAVATAAMAFCELWMMQAETPGQFGTALRWIHVAAFVVIVSLIGFARFYMRVGRPWLAWTVCSLRAFSVLLNFLTGQNLNYREVTGLRHIPFLGESVSVGEGVSNPWMLVGQLSLLLFVVFVADATITVWRRGDRRQVLVLGGSIVFFVLATTVQSVLALWQIVHAPITPSIFYLGIVAAMAYEMSREALRAAQLSDDLRESEERMTLAAEAAGFGVWMWTIARNQIWGSERWLRLFGFAPDAIVSFEKVIQRIHPGDRETVEREVRRALADRVDYAGEYRVILPDGTQRWIVARGQMHSDTHGKPARMLGAAIDITERKRTEEALQNSEEKFRQFFKNTPDYCYIISTDGNILHSSFGRSFSCRHLKVLITKD